MNNFQTRIGTEIEEQGLYPVLEDVLLALRRMEAEAVIGIERVEWAASVFDAILCAFDLDYEKSTEADRLDTI